MAHANLGLRLDSAIAKLVHRPYYTFGMFLTEAYAVRHMVGHRKDLYHMMYRDMDLCVLPKIARTTGNRLVATFHEPPSVLNHLSLEPIVRSLDGVILVSEYQRSYFEKLVDSERIFVVPHGIDTTFFKPPSRRSQLPICITVGAHMRDFQTLDRAMNIIWDDDPNVRLFAVHVEHALATKNTQLASRKLLDDERVHFFSNLSDEQLRQMYQIARLAICPFHDMTASNAILEAMACGLPVIATDVGGAREYLAGTGILCKPSCPEAIARSVRQLLPDSAHAEHMSEASRERALQLDFTKISEQMQTVYAKILGSRSVNGPM